ncbi:MAG: cupin domain-containing protein [Spirochaetales bacterium]|nr:cupin domain-containing protein [Spirochaetales bacterium]
MNAEEIIDCLKLEPLQEEGGYFRRSYYTEYGTAIYYLITPGQRSAFHRLSFDEIWHFYAGDAALQMQLLPDGRAKIFELGNDIENGQHLQLLSPGGVWQSTKLKAGGRWALFGTTMSPPFCQEDYTHGDPDKLAGKYPDYAQMIQEFIN